MYYDEVTLPFVGKLFVGSDGSADRPSEPHVRIAEHANDGLDPVQALQSG